MSTHPPMTAVKSSNIEALGHRGNVLYVRFKGGKLYSYADVPAEVYHAGVASESPGRWFRDRIRGTYRHSIVDA